MKLSRNVFLYMEPEQDDMGEAFAQCSSCFMYLEESCLIHGTSQKIEPDFSCNLYVKGQPISGYTGKAVAAVTSDVSGLVERDVRCENCTSYSQEESTCDFFKKLNEALPDQFGLEIEVDPKGCCSGQRPVDERSI